MICRMMSRQCRTLARLTVVLGLMLAGCGAEGGDDDASRAASSAPSVQTSGAALLTARGRIAVDGAALEAVTSADEPLPLGVALHPADPTAPVTVTVQNTATSPTLVAVVGQTGPRLAAAPRLAVHAWIDRESADEQVEIVPTDDGAAEEGGVVLWLAAGQTATVKVTGLQEGAVLTTEAEGSALLDTLTRDGTGLSDTRGRIRVPSWLRAWVAKAVAKGLVCAAIEAYLTQVQGMQCFNKPIWVPNPFCLWQAVACGYVVQ